MTIYDPRDWFWIVGGDESLAWSSAAGQYVTEYPSDRTTRIGTEDELADVLRPYDVALFMWLAFRSLRCCILGD